MIVLYGAGPGFGLPEISPYVTKTEVQLQLAGLAYRKERATPQQSPKGQVPFIDDDGYLVADSTFVRAYLEQKFDFDLDEGLLPVERAQAWAIERMRKRLESLEDDPTRELLAEAQRIAELLCDTPNIGEAIDARHRRFPMRRFPFALIYRIDADVLRVIALSHRRQRPGYWRGRV